MPRDETLLGSADVIQICGNHESVPLRHLLPINMARKFFQLQSDEGHITNLVFEESYQH